MRVLLGLLIILHGLAHAGAGMWSRGPLWLVTIAWCVSTVAYLGAGFGLMNVPVFRARVKSLILAGAVASLVLLAYLPDVLLVPGIVLDLLFVALTTRWQGLDRSSVRPDSLGGRLALTATALVVLYSAAVILMRPWYMHMGTTRQDRAAALFGDSLFPDARYIVDNAISIRAPADSVWPWLTRIGGHVVAIDSGRALVLENWGAFVIQPVDATTSRLYIRQRNPGKPTLVGIVLAPAGLLVFEPAHFIMQRAMLRGIKGRAEGRAA